MQIEVTTKQKVPVELEPIDALWILAKTLGMEWALDEDRKFMVEKWDEDGEPVYMVLEQSDRFGTWENFSDEGELFMALRNIAASIVSNVYFRSDPYIYGNED